METKGPKTPSVQLWFQVALEDNVAEFFYAQLLFTSAGTVIAALGWIPLPWEIFLAPSIVMILALALRGLRNYFFLRSADFIPAQVGMKTGEFRKYVEHEVLFHHHDQQFRRKFAFQKIEVAEDELLIIAVKKSNPRKFMVVHRDSDQHSLLNI